MESIDLLIKNDRQKKYLILGWGVLIFHTAYFLFLVAHGLKPGLMGLLFIALAFVYRLILYITQKRKIHPDQFFYYLMAAVWAISENYLLAAIILIMGILYESASRQITLTFTKEKIKKHPFPVKYYHWEELDNVILKDDILTLDFKNNKIMQAEIENSEKVNEKDFNDFARARMN